MELDIPEISALVSQVNDLKIMFSQLLAVSKNGKGTVNVKDIARIEGVSESQLRLGGSERYLLPRFGESAYPTGTCRWNIEEYLDWRGIDPKEREYAYRQHLQMERRRGCARKTSTGSSSRKTRSGIA